jgi:molecular chaperone DnaK (HSP70)
VPLQNVRQNNPKNTFAVKRLIGRKFEEKEVQKDISLMPYTISKQTTAHGFLCAIKNWRHHRFPLKFCAK